MNAVVELPEMKVRMVDTAALIPYARNARTHSASQVQQIASSIKEFGWTNPVLVDGDNGIIAGHGRLAAAQLLGLLRIPVIELSGLSEAQKRAYVIADNRLALSAGWDVEMLKLELGDLREVNYDLLLTGFSSEELADLLNPEVPAALCDPDEIPESVAKAYSKVGDLWLCGDHRVLCGDSVSVDDVERLIGGTEKADHAWTDPPYLMGYEGGPDAEGKKKHKHDAILNDKMSKADGEKFLRDIASMIKLKVAGSFYVSFYRLGIEWMMRAMTDVGLKWRNLIIWKKNHINLSNSDYKSMYEPLIYGFSDDYHAVLYGWGAEHTFRGAKGQADVMEVGIPSVWEIDRTKKNTLHPTVKPTALVERSILNSSLPGQSWLDLFGGSGTTLIACQMTGRRAFLMELEPRYVDVIVRRFHMFTGVIPVHAETGEPFPIDKFDTLPVQK